MNQIGSVSASPQAASFPTPTPTASLILSHRPPSGKVALVVGTGRLAASRCFACLEAGVRPIVISEVELDSPRLCDEVRYRVQSGMVSWKTIRLGQNIETTWDALLDELDEGEARSIFVVCITDTLHIAEETASFSLDETPYERASVFVKLCRKRRIPINVADKPELCDFSFPAMHRFPCTDASSPAPSSSLQIAVTTNGRGCRLAGRIRREIVSALPRNVGDAVEKVGHMRDMAKQEDHMSSPQQAKRKQRERTSSGPEEENLSFDSTPLNSPVPQLTSKNPLDKAGSKLKAAVHASSQKNLNQETVKEKEEAAERTKRRMRWVAQISEYWPIEYLGGLREEQMGAVLSTYGEEQQPKKSPEQGQVPEQIGEARGRGESRPSSPGGRTRGRSQHSLDIRPPRPNINNKKGHIYLLGSGTGHPGLLTVLAHRVLASPDTHLILSDKLVPASVLRLIPSTTPLEIAKKFPGNAEGAQSELIAKAIRAAVEEGKTVVRLKQGDPFVYGRGGEEVLAFRKSGIECTVVPGISSALAAPLMLGIPATQRGAADSLVLCTGVGRGGKKVKLPGYERNRTLLVLMGVARLKAVVQTLTGNDSLGHGTPTAEQTAGIGDLTGAPFPPYTPIAIIERASSSDQRMVASTLEGIVSALERSSEQRPPGMMVIGWVVPSLHGEGDVSVSDDAAECTTGEEGSAFNTQEEANAELERRDKARIDRWLGDKGFIVREGLDDAYKASLANLLEQEAAPAPAENSNLEWPMRSETGWAGPRYVDGKPEGGWASNEAPNRPALDNLAHEQDKEYAAIRARAAE